MTHRKTEPNARRGIIKFVIDFRGFTFDFFVTAILITAGHITVRDDDLILCALTVSGSNTATISLVIALVIRMASALVIRAPFFFQLLLLLCSFRSSVH